MVEDALTTTRALHRLLLVASAVSLVFVFSLADVRSERRLLEDLRRLRSLPVADYKEFIDGKVADRITPPLVDSANRFQLELDRQLKAAGLQILGTGRIASVFKSPLHVASLDPEKSVLVQPDATLERLDRIFSDLPVGRDVQIVAADPTPLIPKIVAFISEGTPRSLLGIAIARIENVQVQVLDAPYEAIDSFLPPDTLAPQLLLTFELHRDGAGAPIFEERFPGTVQGLPDSSLREWLVQKARAGDLFKEVNGRVRWLSDSVPSSVLRNSPLNALERKLDQQIEATTAKNRTIDLPGISVPGSLALFAIPLLLLSLASSLLRHLEHLQRLAPDHRDLFVQFAWTPLTANSWRWEMAVTTALLPALVQIILAWRYDAFELPVSLVITTAVAGAVGSFFLGWKAVQSLGNLRGVISAVRDEEAGDYGKD